MSLLHAICLRCPHVQPPPYAGKCDCLHDPAKPVDIIDRAKSRICPAGKFPLISEDELERQGWTPELAHGEAKWRSCCDPPAQS